MGLGPEQTHWEARSPGQGGGVGGGERKTGKKKQEKRSPKGKFPVGGEYGEPGYLEGTRGGFENQKGVESNKASVRKSTWKSRVPRKKDSVSRSLQKEKNGATTRRESGKYPGKRNIFKGKETHVRGGKAGGDCLGTTDLSGLGIEVEKIRRLQLKRNHPTKNSVE